MTFFFGTYGVVLGLVVVDEDVVLSVNSKKGGDWLVDDLFHFCIDEFAELFFSSINCCLRILIASWMTSTLTCAAAANSSMVCPFKSISGKSSFGKYSTFVGCASLSAVIELGKTWNSGTAYTGLIFVSPTRDPANVCKNLLAPVNCQEVKHLSNYRYCYLRRCQFTFRLSCWLFIKFSFTIKVSLGKVLNLGTPNGNIWKQ